jgi:hypothetical protein
MILTLKELSWITASSSRSYLNFFINLIIFIRLIDKNSFILHFARKMLSRSNSKLIIPLEQAFRSFNLLFNLLKEKTEKVSSFYLFSFSQLFFGNHFQICSQRNFIFLWFFWKNIRKNHIFKKITLATMHSIRTLLKPGPCRILWKLF